MYSITFKKKEIQRTVRLPIFGWARAANQPLQSRPDNFSHCKPADSALMKLKPKNGGNIEIETKNGANNRN